MLKFIGQYIGPDKIVEIKLAKRKTFLGNDVAEVTFENKKKMEYPLVSLNAITSKEKSDLTVLRNREAGPIAEKILAILTESELPISSPTRANIYYIIQDVVPESVQENTRKAYGKIFDKDYYEINMLDLDKVLNAEQKKNTTGNTKDDYRK